MKINEQLVSKLKEKNLKIATAESMTGGHIAAAIIDIPGASNVIEQGFIVYSDEAKSAILGVEAELIEAFGVVSKEVALAMARKLKEKTGADIVVATTGEAGPTVSQRNIQVGTVCYALIIHQGEYVYQRHFAGDRQGIINHAVEHILGDLYYKII